MRQPFVAGNWKMNKTVDQAKALIAEMLPGLEAAQQAGRELCPPFPIVAEKPTILSHIVRNSFQKSECID